MNQDNISFDLPKNRSNVIKVIGVGGGGSNAVNYMYTQGFKGVDFVVCNTDEQALASSPVPNKIQLGVNLTEGLGAGASPEVGGEAAMESLEDLKSMLSTNTKMLFLTAGMGGGTGTGAAPVIAKLASEMGILTVGIVTMPFKFEGAMRHKQAQAGVDELKKYVDSMIIINNNKLREEFGDLRLKEGFAKADEVLATAARGISEVITNHSGINIDLRDAKTVLQKSGTAIMGSAVASGENRAEVAISKALDSPLLNDNTIRGAKQVLLLIISGKEEITLDEMGIINEYIQSQSGGNTNIIMGVGEDEGIGDGIKVTVIATGFSRNQQDVMIDKAPKKTIHQLQSTDENVESKENVEQPKSVIREEPKEVKTENTERIVHKLEEEVEDDVEVKIEQSLPKEDVSPVSQPSVSEDKTIMDVSDDDIVIQEAQTTIEFDFDSVNNNISEEEVPEKKVFDLGSHDEIEEEVADEVHENIINRNSTVSNVEPTIERRVESVEPQRFSDGSVKYNLADFEEIESKIESATAIHEEEKVEEEVEPEMQIHIVEKPKLEVVEEVEKQQVSEPFSTEVPVDPTEIPLSRKEKIGKERRERLKRFNHNFKSRTMNPSSVDDLERQPAYLRAGVDLSQPNQRNSASRYSIGSDGEDVVLRRNNSFLHDNVD